MTSSSRRDRPAGGARRPRAAERLLERRREQRDLGGGAGGDGARAETAGRPVGLAQALDRLLASPGGGQRDTGAQPDVRPLERDLERGVQLERALELRRGGGGVALRERRLAERVGERGECVAVPGGGRDRGQRLGARAGPAAGRRGGRRSTPRSAAPRPRSGGPRCAPSGRARGGSARRPPRGRRSRRPASPAPRRCRPSSRRRRAAPRSPGSAAAAGARGARRREGRGSRRTRRRRRALVGRRRAGPELAAEGGGLVPVAQLAQHVRHAARQTCSCSGTPAVSQSATAVDSASRAPP